MSHVMNHMGHHIHTQGRRACASKPNNYTTLARLSPPPARRGGLWDPSARRRGPELRHGGPARGRFGHDADKLREPVVFQARDLALCALGIAAPREQAGVARARGGRRHAKMGVLRSAGVRVRDGTSPGSSV